MSNNKAIKVALVGNPNTGKTSLFNQLTGLNQKVGNYPGITVDKKIGVSQLPNNKKATILDLPGTYSINPTTLDENIVLRTLLDTKHEDYPDVIVVVADIENIKRNLLLYSQIKDLQIPTILAINMADQISRKGIEINLELLKKELKTEVVLISARKNQGIEDLKEIIEKYQSLNTSPLANISNKIDAVYFNKMREDFPNIPLYKIWLYITQLEDFESLSDTQKENIIFYKKDREKLKKYSIRKLFFATNKLMRY